MADNVTLDSMSGGSIVATDDIGGVHHQLVKVEFGAANSATQVDATNPLPTTVISGTTAVNTPGTITSGSIAVTAGTVQATLASPGTITSGSITVTAGTVGTVGAVGQVHNAGTIQGGTVGVVSNITNGSIVVTAGTVQATLASPGTITSGTVAINAGTVGGKAASGAASVANPVQIAGTDSGGTIYSPLITTAGAIGSIVNIGTIKEAGTVTGVGTVPGVGVVTTVTNLSNGTIQNSGTTTGVGVVTSVGQVVTGTIANSGTSTGVGVVSNLTNGSIKVTAGTVIVTTGTVNSGTINAGTINSGTVNSGTINVGTISPVPSKMISVIGSVWGTSSGTAGTLVAAPTSGSAIYINELSITNEGTSTLTAGMGFGTGQQGTTVLARTFMAGNGGIEKGFPTATTGGGTQLPLVMWTTGSGTATFCASYFIAL